MVVCSRVCTPEMTTVIKTDSLDFDRDEMNVHFPQDEISRAEAYNIANANNQYARPSNGDPLRALIQDEIIHLHMNWYRILFTRYVFNIHTISFNAELLTVTPAILKPKYLFGPESRSSRQC
ncbi:unnamed protein product [Brassica oleracea var. botrytis]